MTRDEVRAAARRVTLWHKRFTPLFGRKEAQEHSLVYVRGLLSDQQRKSIEPIALHFARRADGAAAAQNEVVALQGFITFSTWKEKDVPARNGKGNGRRRKTPTEVYVPCNVEPGMFRGEYLVTFEAVDSQDPNKKVRVRLLADESDVVIRSGTPDRGSPAEGLLRVEILKRANGLAFVVLPQPAQPGIVVDPLELIVSRGLAGSLEGKAGRLAGQQALDLVRADVQAGVGIGAGARGVGALGDLDGTLEQAVETLEGWQQLVEPGAASVFERRSVQSGGRR